MRKRIVITGASRGIGLGFCLHYLNAGYEVYACYRRDPAGLRALQSSRLHLVKWDVRCPEPETGAAWPESVDLLINNAGVYGPAKAGQGLESVSDETMHEVFDVNCLGPIRVVRHLRDRLIKGRGVVANISSKMGSITENTSGNAYAYRASKAALNAVSKSMALDLAPFGVHVLILHPGWVKTDMGGPSALIDVEEAVSSMTRLLERARDFPAGSFLAFDGSTIPF